MPQLVHELVTMCAKSDAQRTAMTFKNQQLSYTQLGDSIQKISSGILSLGINRGDRVAIYLPKQLETVAAIFGSSCAGACFVPVNPVLKPRQVSYIVNHCGARILITSLQRLEQLSSELSFCPSLSAVIVVDASMNERATQLIESHPGLRFLTWPDLLNTSYIAPHRQIDGDMAAILYTSGSTGAPKGVVLSHRNIVAGAESVSEYLDNTPADKILAVLPLSFDAGLSQLTTAFSSGASVILMDYLLPRDVLRALVRYQATGLAAVPPLWNQLAQLEWDPEIATHLRYLTNTGGIMPTATTRELVRRLPHTRIFLMYGLTEAFRSTYLPPEQVSVRPDSIGKAIPGAEILVVNEAGELCEPNEPGELVHRGALVAMGYWNDPEKTAERFRPCPGRDKNLPLTEIAVWSGDQVVRDEEGYLYFVSRKDDMIKTSGYRVSPNEIEEIAHESGLVSHAVALGIHDEQLGQRILLIVTAARKDIIACPADDMVNVDLLARLTEYCKHELPGFMQPARILLLETLPLNQNGKIDRRSLARQYGIASIEYTPERQFSDTAREAQG